jgi:pilus assembly protein CpaF
MEMDVAFGPIADFISDPTIEEIWINSPQRIFVARAGKSELTNLLLTSDEVRQLVDRLLIWSGRRLDLSHPFVDARLPDGSRLHVVIPEITAEHWIVNIRKHLMRHLSLRDLAERGVLTPKMADALSNSVKAGLNILVSGGTQSGKTTLLNALAGLSSRYAQGLISFTTRQSAQFHRLNVRDLPQFLREVDAAGLSTFHGCGDVTRNVAACP